MVSVAQVVGGCVYAGPALPTPDASTDDGAGAATAKDAGFFSTGAPWEPVTNNLMELAPSGGDISLSSEPGSGRIFAAPANSGLFATEDGETWYRLGAGPGSDAVQHLTTGFVYDPDHPKTWWEVGIYGTGPSRTDDSGLTFKYVGNMSHNDLISIDFTDPERKTMLLSPHEKAKQLYLSRDSGATWKDIGTSLPEDSLNYSVLPHVIDSNTFLLGACGNLAVPCEVLRSSDGGDSWTRVSTAGPGSPLLKASDGTLYWSLFLDGMIVSTDDGETWTQTAPGPAALRYARPVELPDGRIATIGKKYVLLTSDRGKSWRAVGSEFPVEASQCGIFGLVYSTSLRKFFINHNNCTAKIFPKALYSASFDYESE